MCHFQFLTFEFLIFIRLKVNKILLIIYIKHKQTLRFPTPLIQLLHMYYNYFVDFLQFLIDFCFCLDRLERLITILCWNLCF